MERGIYDKVDKKKNVMRRMKKKRESKKTKTQRQRETEWKEGIRLWKTNEKGQRNGEKNKRKNTPPPGKKITQASTNKLLREIMVLKEL